MPAAAVLFRRALVPPANGVLTLEVPREEVYDLLAEPVPTVPSLWGQTGFEWHQALTSRLRVAFVDGGGKARLSTGTVPGASAVEWKAAEPEKALYLLDAPEALAAVGFLGGRTVRLGAAQIEMKPTPTNFAAIMLVSLDGKPLAQSAKMLLSAVGRAQNSGWQWNANHTMLTDWGHDPTLIEPLAVDLYFPTSATELELRLLDGKGCPKGTVPCVAAAGRAHITLAPEHRTVWYELVAR